MAKKSTGTAPARTQRGAARTAARKPAVKADIAALPRKISYVIIYVDHWDKTLSWYKDVLGLPVTCECDGWAEFATGEATLALHGTEGGCHGHDLKETGICFAVKNVDQTLSVLREREVKIVGKPQTVCEGTRCATIADPEGHTFSLVGK